MKSLSQFAGHQQIFSDAEILPAFFQTNLVDPARVVKIFENDPQAQIRIFYYQYLKLCFELENVNYDLYIRKIEEIINNPDFEFIFYPNDDPSIFNDTQAKSLIMEFFGVLGQGSQTVLQALTGYPILDKIFIHFFRSLLILSNVTDSLDNYIDRDGLLDFLCKTFEVDAQIHGECIRYTETDIFIFEQSPYAVYMAYMDYEAYNNSLERSANEALATNGNNYDITQSKNAVLSSFNPSSQENRAPEVRVDRSMNMLAKDSYIASEFVDFTSNVEALTAKAKITLKESGMDQPVPEVKKPVTVAPPPPPPQPPVIIRSEPPVVVTPPPPQPVKEAPFIIKETPKLIPQPIQNFNSIPQVQSIASTKQQLRSEVIKTDYWQPSTSVITQQNAYKNNNFETSIKYPAQNTQPDRFSPTVQAPPQVIKNQPQPQPNIYPSQIQQPIINKNDVYYSPKNENTAYNLGAFSSSKVEEAKDIKSVTTYGAPGKKKPFGLNISQEFTSTEVSKLMAEPHRSNVQSMKTRARNFRSSLANYIK